MSFACVPYVHSQAEKKGRTKAEVDQIIHWWTGYTLNRSPAHLKKETDYEHFSASA